MSWTFLLMGTVTICTLSLWLRCLKGIDILTGFFLLFALTQQQDVSEFTHKLLDWLEDAFQMKAEEDR